MLCQTQVFARGTTITWTTTFYDQNGNVVQPDAATISLVSSDETINTSVSMASPAAGQTAWTGSWDSRGAPAPRTIYWSIHSGQPNDPIPVVVEDGQFTLTANPANLLTF